MKRNCAALLISIAAIMLGFGVGITHAQTNWTKHPGNPVLDLGGSGDWDAQDVLRPAVLLDIGIYKMWYGGVDQASNHRSGYATSSDGVNWTKHPGNPILSEGSSGQWDDSGATVSAVLFDSGLYQMWYEGSDGSNQRIGYATSTNGITWTKHASNPVLNLGASGQWDDANLARPSVLIDGGGYKMWYAGEGGSFRIGYATSSDGVNWTKYPGNPVLDLGGGGQWDDSNLFTPFVLLDSGVYHMWYGGNDGATWRIGYATSSDGITWTKHPSSPVLEPGAAGTWDDKVIYSPSVLRDSGIFKMWYQGTNGPSWRIGYATSIPPNSPPTITCPTPATAECTSPAGAEVDLAAQVEDPDGDALTVTWNVDGDDVQTDSVPAGGPPTSANVTLTHTYALGAHTVTVTVDDGTADPVSCQTAVTVEDTEPPVITTAAPLSLWPPNHKYETIDITQCVLSVEDDCAGSIPVGSVVITSVSSDEPEDVKGGGDGKTTDDIVIAPGCQSVQLRRERQGGGNGRVYTIEVAVDDGNGNVGTAACQVTVPHDQSGDPAVDDGPAYTVTSGCSPAAPPVTHGDLHIGQVRFPAAIVYEIPAKTELLRNYPNPFNPETWIPYRLAKDVRVVIEIYDGSGLLIRTLDLGHKAAGVYASKARAAYWDGRSETGELASSGVYYYHLRAGNYKATKRMIILK